MAEIYKGIKFSYESIGKTPDNYELLPDLKKWCKIFSKKDLAPSYPGGSSGNLSIRTKRNESVFLITASHTALKPEMPDSDFCEIFSYNETNNTIIGKGKKQPSSESIMHYFIYDNNPEINAVFHGHSAEILQYAEKLRIPITEKEEPYGTIKAAKEVLKSLKKHNFIVMRNHGFVSCGKTAEEAGKNVLEVLNMCKTFKQ